MKSSEHLYSFYKQALLFLHAKQNREANDSVAPLYQAYFSYNEKIKTLFHHFNSSGRYPRSSKEPTCLLHKLIQQAVDLMENPDLDHGFQKVNGEKIDSNRIRKELHQALLGALDPNSEMIKAICA